MSVSKGSDRRRLRSCSPAWTGCGRAPRSRSWCRRSRAGGAARAARSRRRRASAASTGRLRTRRGGKDSDARQRTQETEPYKHSRRLGRKEQLGYVAM
eukprot:6196777-Pleurochrysis_carterae.AAC.3